MKTSEATTTVAVVNQQQIIIIENGEKRIAIKPICAALGIDPDWQIARIKEDEILGQLPKISYVVAADGKSREMITIPFKYVFGWLFSINPKRVAPEAKDAMVRYKKEVYDVLYEHFTAHAEFAEWKQRQLKAKTEELKEVKANFSEAKERLKQTENAIDDIFKLSLDDYKTMKAQMVLEFPTEEERRGE